MAAIASQFVNGMEGKDMTGQLLLEGGGYIKVNTTLKHYAANNSEFDRLYGNSSMDDRTLREYYTPNGRRLWESR
jgi:beta-glucosidase